MRQKSFIISIIATLFVLGIVAGVARAAYMAQQPPVEDAAQLKQTLTAREALYQQTITEANTRLEQANLALQQMQQQVDAQQSQIAQASIQSAVPAAAAPQAATQTAVSGQQAAQTALAAANNWAAPDSSQPELVDYQGSTAFEVKLAGGGNMVIDSQSGSLLYNSLTGSAKAVISEDQAAKAAQTYLKGGGVFKVLRSQYNGQPAYRVIFDVGHRIYVSLGGDILYVELYSLQVNSGGGGGGGGGGASSQPAAAAPPPAAPSHHEDDGGSGDD